MPLHDETSMGYPFIEDSRERPLPPGQRVEIIQPEVITLAGQPIIAYRPKLAPRQARVIPRFDRGEPMVASPNDESRVLVIANLNQGEFVELTPPRVIDRSRGNRSDNTLIVGRNPDSDLRVGNDHVSGRHVVFDLTGNEFGVTDLSSTNGSKISEFSLIDEQTGIAIQTEGVGYFLIKPGYESVVECGGMEFSPFWVSALNPRDARYMQIRNLVFKGRPEASRPQAGNPFFFDIYSRTLVRKPVRLASIFSAELEQGGTILVVRVHADKPVTVHEIQRQQKTTSEPLLTSSDDSSRWDDVHPTHTVRLPDPDRDGPFNQ